MNYQEVHLNFCQNIRHLRKVHLLTQKEMARVIGISVGTLGRIEHCDPSIRIHCVMLHRICNHFQISADALLFENWPRMIEERFSALKQ